MRPAATLLLVLAALAACNEAAAPVRKTPAEALAALRVALVAQDGRALAAVLDSDSISFRHGMVREWRALLARGDDPQKTLAGVPVPPETIRAGTEDDAVAALLSKNFPLLADARWYADAAVAAEEAVGPDTAVMRLRGADGAEKDLWFLRENGDWRFDQFRTRQQ